MRWLASLMHGLQFGVTEQDRFNESEVEILGVTMPLTPVAAFWDDPVTAKLVTDLAGRELPIPGTPQGIKLNSFAMHILLTAVCHSDVWSQAELENAAIKVQHHLWVLLYCIHHQGKLPQSFGHQNVNDTLKLRSDSVLPKPRYRDRLV